MKLFNRNLFYILLAGMVAIYGLLGDSITPIIGSMIISPLLTPVSKSIFNTIYKKQENTIINNIYFTFIIIISVILLGIICSLINYKIKIYPNETNAMKSRSSLNLFNKIDYKFNKSMLTTELGVAIMVGIGLPFAMIFNDSSLMIAFAISPSLTPPLVNAGLYMGNYIYTNDINNLYKALNTGSIGLFNYLIIQILIAIILYIYMKLI